MRATTIASLLGVSASASRRDGANAVCPASRSRTCGNSRICWLRASMVPRVLASGLVREHDGPVVETSRVSQSQIETCTLREEWRAATYCDRMDDHPVHVDQVALDERRGQGRATNPDLAIELGLE